MSVDLAREIWQELRRYVSDVDHDDAAVTMVTVMSDHGFNADEIMNAFKNDAAMRRVVADFFETEDQIYDDEDDDPGFDDDDYFDDDD